MNPIRVLLSLLALSTAGNAAFFYPDSKTSEIEHILVDTHGAYASGFADAITPCSNYVSGAQTFGRETAAQWLRVAFHDFVTAHVDEGTGGIDASIGFETLREEDSGSAFNDSFAFFRPYVNARVSMADLVATSVVVSVGNCGGPQIPLRGGRIDATGPGEEGVPAPETSLELTLEFFANAGFNQVDSIGLTACGHTLGSVHHGGFPTVVGPEAVTPNNTAGGIHFDASVDVFDIKVVHEYIDGTGNQGGPLVTSFNESSRSDLRLYESDGNVTMRRLYDQGAGFLNTCVPLFQRMIETIPSNVVLSDVISPLAIKPVNATLDFSSNGSLIFTGAIRVLVPPGSIPPASIALAALSHTDITLNSETATGTSIFGTSAYFPFAIPVTSLPTLKSFTITASSRLSQTFAIPFSGSFVVPSLSSSISSSTSTIINVTIASQAQSYGPPKVVLKAPIPQQGTLGPAIANYSVSSLKAVRGKSGFVLWEGSVDLGVVATGSVAVEVMNGNDLADLLFL